MAGLPERPIGLLDRILHRVGSCVDVAADAANRVRTGSYAQRHNQCGDGDEARCFHFEFLPTRIERSGRVVPPPKDGIVPHPGETECAKSRKVQVIACGMLAREILAVIEANRLDHIDLTCLPAEFHYYPDRIPAALEAAILKARAEGYGQVFVGYADCGTGGMIDRVCERHGVERIAGPHCFAFYQGLAAFERVAEGDMLSFYMTDFLCRHFDAFFMKPLGLDRHPELIADFFGNYEKVVYLAQTDDPALEAVAVKAAALLGLSYEKRRTGYGDLADSLVGVMPPAG